MAVLTSWTNRPNRAPHPYFVISNFPHVRMQIAWNLVLRFLKKRANFPPHCAGRSGPTREYLGLLIGRFRSKSTNQKPGISFLQVERTQSSVVGYHIHHVCVHTLARDLNARIMFLKYLTRDIRIYCVVMQSGIVRASWLIDSESDTSV